MMNLQTLSTWNEIKQKKNIENLEPIELSENETLYQSTYFIIDLNHTNILSNSKGIIWVLKPWRESVNFIEQTLRTITWDSNIWIRPIIYQSNYEEYLTWKTIKKVNIKVASWAIGRNLLWNNEVEKSMENLFKVAEEIWWDTLSIEVWKHNWLISWERLKWFLWLNSDYIEEVNADICNAWNIINQSLKNIRFKSKLKLWIDNFQLNTSEVKNKMNKNYKDILSEIKTEYNYTPTP